MTKLADFDPAVSRRQLLTGLNLAIAEARTVHNPITRKTAPRNLEKVRILVGVEREIK